MRGGRRLISVGRCVVVMASMLVRRSRWDIGLRDYVPGLPSERPRGLTDPVGGVGETGPMATWREFESDAPELAAAVQARFEATKHHVLATLRPGGAPRV